MRSKMGRLSARFATGILAAVAIGAIELASPPVVSGSAVCPAPPDTLAGLISPDAVETGPLTGQFRPVYGVYSEAAASCWAGAEIEVVGFVANPEGLGGVEPFSIEPAWMVSRGHFLSTTDSIDPQTGPVGPFFPTAVPPSLESAFRALEGSWIRVTGHFDDRAAETCVIAASSPDLGAVPTAEQAIAICRTSFVLSVVEPAKAPATDTGAVRPAETLPGWVGLVVAIAAFISVGLVLRRRSASTR